jgi:quercetin dioxygenase-like cupin family protein
VIEESKRLPPGPGKRYVYDMTNDADSMRAPASAVVTPDARLRLPHGITGKLLTGERLHVGVLRFARGAKLANYRRDNEQFVFVVVGELEVELEDDALHVPERCLLHIPAGTRHELVAINETIVVIAQDQRG